MKASGSAPAAHLRRAGQWAMGAAVLTIGLITYGAWVRVSGAGLGCPDWPLCEGAIVPELEGATAIEFGHRVYAGVTMLATALAAWYAFRARAVDPRTNRLLLGALAAILAQAGLGGATVLTELHGMVRLAHLTFSLLTLALLTIGALQALGLDPRGAARRAAHAGAAGRDGFRGAGGRLDRGHQLQRRLVPRCRSATAAWVARPCSCTCCIGSGPRRSCSRSSLPPGRSGGAAASAFPSICAWPRAFSRPRSFAVGILSMVIGLRPELRVLHLALATLLWWVVVIHFTLALQPRPR